MKEINLFFTDLDSTVLDNNYNFNEIAFKRIKEAFTKNFVIIFTSSKTLAEEKYFSSKLGIPVVYTVENGSALYIPENIFDNCPHKNGCRKFVLTSLTISYIRKVLFQYISVSPGIKFYGNSTIREIVNYTNLPVELAELARKREYTETIFSGYNDDVEEFLIKNGLYPQKGSRFITVGNKTDKGKAAKMLIKILKEAGYKVGRIIGVGDGPNDVPLLELVKEPYIIGNKIFLKGAYKIQSFEEIKL